MLRDRCCSHTFRIRRLKAALLSVSLTLAGILLIMLNAWLRNQSLGAWAWLHDVPLGELGGALFAAGFLGTLFEYTFRKEQEAAVAEQFRTVIKEQAPAMRDAVIEGFRFQNDDLERIATPQLLDELAENSLGMRFGDAQFGREGYADIRHQAMTAKERWYDARIDATLGIPRGRSNTPTPYLDLLVRWEYSVIPKHRFRKFAVVSDRQRYNQLVAERGETSVWYRRPAPGFDVIDPEVFVLEQFTINGVAVPFERQADDVSQVYVVDLGDEVIKEGKAIIVAFSFRTLTSRTGHAFNLGIDRPTKGLEAELRFDPSVIRSVRLMDFASRGEGGVISEDSDAASLRYRYDGWVFPRAGLVYTWELIGEAVATDSANDAKRDARRRKAA